MKLHIDFDSYFVNAERVKNKELIGVPCVIFAGSNDDFFDLNPIFDNDKISFMGNIIVDKTPLKNIDYKHFTVIAASYEAKKFGIKVGDKLNEAFRKYPDLKIARSNIRYYKELSYKVKQFLQTKLPVIEQFSIDEFFADLAGFKKDDEVLDYAKYIQKELLKKFELPASIGISKSKWSAKLLTDLAKPFGIKYEPDIKNSLVGIDIKNFAGIGKATQNYLRSYGINTLDELIKRPEVLNKYGKNGSKLLARVLGEDNEEVGEENKLKSHAISKSFKPINDIAELRRRVKILSRYLCVWISKNKLHPRKLEVSIKYNTKFDNVNLSLNQPFYEKNLIEKSLEGFEMLLKNTHQRHINVYYLGLSVSNLDKTYSENIFDSTNNEKAAKLNETLSVLRERFGINSIKYGE